MSTDDERPELHQPNDDEQYELDLNVEELIESVHFGTETPPVPEHFEENPAAHYTTAMRALAMLSDQLGGEFYANDRLKADLRWISGQFRRLVAVSLPLGFGSRAKSAKVLRKTLAIWLDDGREVRTPLDWFPGLAAASQAQQANLRIIEDGRAISWPEIDAVLDVAALLAASGPQAGATPNPRQSKGDIPSAGSIVTAFEISHGPISDRARGLIGQRWGPTARSRPSDGSGPGSTPGGATEVAQSDDAESPVLDGEDELIAYLDGLAVESNSPIVDDLAAVIETLFVTEAASLRESGHTVDVRVDEASGQLTVTLAVAPDAWARKLIITLNPRFAPHVGARILDDNGDMVADIGESVDVDAGIALALAWAGIARLRGELG